MILSYIVIVILLLSVVYLYLDNKNNNKDPELSEPFKKIREELINLKTDKSSLETTIDSLKEQITELKVEINTLNDIISEKERIITEIKIKNGGLDSDNKRLIEENKIKKSLEERVKILEIENQKQVVEIEEKEKNITQFTELQEQIKNQFKVISNEVIKEQKENFNKEQNESLSHLLNPLNKDIKEFKEKIEKVQKESNDNTTIIKENIKHLVEKTTDIGNKADNLATALKGDKKAQGNWGEFQLQNLLEMSGLQEGVSFLKQYNIKNDNGDNFFLDFLIKLPEDRILIVDSKVSMVNYEKYISSNNSQEKEMHLKAYCEDIKNHIKGLGSKEYQNVYKEYNKKLSKDTPDFVFMFVAIEGAYIDAIKFDKTIFDIATKNKVALITTSSFMPVLRMIEHLWNIENQNKYITDIVDLAKKLYDKMYKFSDDMVKIGKGLDNAQKAYESAKNYISTGRGNILSLSNKIISIADKKKIKDKLPIEFDEDGDSMADKNNIINLEHEVEESNE